MSADTDVVNSPETYYRDGGPCVLRVADAAKGYGSEPLFTGVSFVVRPGTAIALVGSNGAGKSTFLRCVLGADSFDDGSVEMDGVALDERDPAVRAAVAASIEELSVFPDLSVLEHLDVLACAHDVAEPARAVDEVLDEVGLSGAAHQLPVTLSSGQRRRLALASCLVRPRRLLVLDEPESSLDAAGRRWLGDRLVAEKDAGGAVLFACHDGELVDRVADDVVRIGA